MKAPIYLISYILFLGFAANAQKLPNIQPISLQAPSDIKIDGKSTEWNDHFQAYNKSTNIYYTIANDDKYLYLAVQASQTKDPGIIDKILGGGITFSINKSGKKNFEDAVRITYPILKKDDRMFVNFSADDNKKIVPDITTPYMNGDSFVALNNDRLTRKSKYIMVTGIKGLDTLISIYNQDGIKAVALFDAKMAYTYELAIDLHILGLNTDNAVKFTYNITLQGRPDPIMEAVKNEGLPPGIKSVRLLKYTPTTIGVDNYISTDFWGEYTLAKK